MNSPAAPGPRKVVTFLPSMNTGAAGASPVPGSEMPISACLDSPGPVDDAAHHRDGQRLHPGVAAFPLRHLLADEILDVAGELLERGRGGAAAAGTGGDQRHEGAEAHALQQFLRHLHFERAVAVRLRRERDADGVADPLLEQHAERGRRGDDALRPHAGLGQPEMQRQLGAGGEHGVDGDQILHRRHLGRQHDLVGTKPELHRARRADQRRLHDGLMHHVPRVLGLGQRRVLVHQAGEQVLIEAAPVDADAHRLAVAHRDLDDLGELPVALVLEADIAGIDAVFGEAQRRRPDALSAACGRYSGSRRSAAPRPRGHRAAP